MSTTSQAPLQNQRHLVNIIYKRFRYHYKMAVGSVIRTVSAGCLASGQDERCTPVCSFQFFQWGFAKAGTLRPLAESYI